MLPIRFPFLALAAAALLAACGGSAPTVETSAASAADGRAFRLGDPLGASIAATLPACPAPTAALAEITEVQGAGNVSPLEGQTVTVRGVVTADFRGSARLGGLFIQQPVPDADPATSEGLFVFTTSTVGLAPGDFVQVTGTVTEFKRSAAGDPLTQIAGATVLERCGTAALPAPEIVALPMAAAGAFERYEGMLVRFEQSLFVSGNFTLGRFGELVLSAGSRLYHPNNHPTLTADEARAANALNRVVLDDGSSVQNPNPIPHLSAADTSGTRRAGDRVQGLQGILTMDFDAWRVQATVAPAFAADNPRPAAPEPVAGALRVASLNVLNFFTTLGARGASDAAEYQRQLDKLVSTIVALDADVLGLVEIENNNAVALGALVDAVNRRLGTTAYALKSPGVPGSDAITTAIIYKPARVAAVGNVQVPDDPDFAADGGLRPPVALRFAARDNGGGFWFVVNHLKSKGGCPTDATSPDRDLGQGCWNAARVRQAQALVRWVDGLVAASGEPDVLMAGDFNAYLKEDPLAVLRTAGHENLLDRLPPSRRYSYVFGNEAGALDHAFASATLTAQVSGVAVWNSNADEPVAFDYNLEFRTDDRYAPLPHRASDHDPVLVGLTLAADPPPWAPALDARLPTAGSTAQAVVITGIAAQPVPGTFPRLTVDWGDGTLQSLPFWVDRAEVRYARAGTYRITLTLGHGYGLTAVLSVPITVTEPPAVDKGLFISEYIEGSSFNKAIELYNPSDQPVDLARYTLRLYSNGSPTPTASVTLSGTLAPRSTYVLCHPSISAAALPACQLTSSSVINFNGDDALRLERDGVVVDQFGQVGFDPGTAWTDGGLSTLDRTLRRKAAITEGSVPPGPPQPWALSAEWDGLPINTLDGLGSR